MDEKQNTNNEHDASDWVQGTIDVPFPSQWREMARLNSKALEEGKADEIFTKGRFFTSLEALLWGRPIFGVIPK